ncbi:hypothetical protein, partial [Rhodococcus qingshengii]|uniref:hypothetical protein n=1 Tax=Rhodococcus qingshengii TaxID=334542 RepID=UPI001C604537
TAPAFSSGEYRRIVGLPDTRSFGMLPSSFPRPEVSTEPRAIQSCCGLLVLLSFHITSLS